MRLKQIGIIMGIVLAVLSAGCKNKPTDNHNQRKSRHERRLSFLKDSLQVLADSYPGEIGIAVITDKGDTVTVNNGTKYPLMSVFKLHQAIALCHLFDQRGTTLDTIVRLQRKELNPDTWSPMLKEHPEDDITLPISELLKYTLTLSDNNASNWLFENIEGVEPTDRYIATIIPRQSFNIKHTEAQMSAYHSLCYANRTSPLGAAELICRLYNDSIISYQHADFIRTTLNNCKTGEDRIAAPLKDNNEITLGHKTGSGYRNNNGLLTAHNDVGFVKLSDGRSYTLAVFVKDFDGTEAEASSAIAVISDTVYSWAIKFL